MTAALAVIGYALTLAWLMPALLTRLTRGGISARLGLAAWLTAMGSVLAAAGLALQFLVRAAVAGRPRLSEVVCRSVAGGACTPVIYRSALFEASPAVPPPSAALAAGGGALAATGGAVTARVQRLLGPAPRTRHVGYGLALLAVMLLLLLAVSALITAYAALAVTSG